jgi:hypothetical protein
MHPWQDIGHVISSAPWASALEVVGARAQGAHRARRDRILSTHQRCRPSQQQEGRPVAQGYARCCHYPDTVTGTDSGSAVTTRCPNDCPATSTSHHEGGTASTVTPGDHATCHAGRLLPPQR